MNLASQLPSVLTGYGASFLVSVIGTVLALALRPKHLGLLVGALALMFVQAVAGTVFQLVIVPGMIMEHNSPAATMASAYLVFGIVSQVLFIASWVLVIIAIMRNRRGPAADRQGPAAGGPQGWGNGPGPGPGGGPYASGPADGRPPYPGGPGPGFGPTTGGPGADRPPRL